MEENKSQRIRRTRNELRAAMLDAVMQLAKEKELALITMVDVSERSGIRVDVLVRNFTSMEKMLSIYAASVDYWLSDLFHGRHPIDHTGEHDIKDLFTNLVKSFYKDWDMQRLLVWEITEDNPTTRRIAASREAIYQDNIESYKNLFKDSGIHIDILLATLTAGIYYLILRRKRSTFLGVDFSKRSERKRLIEAIEQVIGMIFEKLREHDRIAEIARKMKENGISDEVIARCIEPG